jgi:hypothetical protein
MKTIASLLMAIVVDVCTAAARGLFMPNHARGLSSL